MAKVVYDLDGSQRGIQECPKCHFTMENLRDSRVLDREEGYILDSGTGWDPDDHPATSYLFGSLSRYFWRHFLEPLLSKLFGDYRKRRYQRILAQYPASLICPHCAFLIKWR